MRFALSTNWCNRRIATGEEIADVAASLGFEALELGFHTTQEQVKGFKARLDEMPVGSIHAFCPVPISAPQGYPELYQLASLDEAERAIARVHVRRNIAFAADMGADAVVLHAGRVMCRGFLRRWDMKRRVRRGRKVVDALKKELDGLVADLERNGVVLGLENLPYLEGFPAEWEVGEVRGEWVKPWLDTGHDFVRRTNGWDVGLGGRDKPAEAGTPQPIGLHINDSAGGDDHLPPGEGRVDFAALAPIASKARHLVFEPHSEVKPAQLRAGLAHVRKLWSETGSAD